MNKLLIILLAFLAFLCLSQGFKLAKAPLADDPQLEAGFQSRNIEIIPNIKSFMQQHPQLRFMPLKKKASVDRTQHVQYWLGKRVMGDRLMTQYANSYYYSTPQDVSAQVNYPTDISEDSVVTFVEVDCLQDNDEGNAYIVGGGIGEHFISIVIEAKQTQRFIYNVRVYGKN